MSQAAPPSRHARGEFAPESGEPLQPRTATATTHMPPHGGKGDHMADEYLNYIVLLENTLGTYYGKIKNLPRLEGARSVLEFMETHSFEHADLIREAGGKRRKPALRESMITDFQNDLVEKVFRQISDEKDILSVLEKLANSEESLGKLYHGIADLMVRIGDYYREIAAEIAAVADQEFNHRDLLLKDRERLKQKMGK